MEPRQQLATGPGIRPSSPPLSAELVQIGRRAEGRLRFLTMAYFEQPFQVERVLPNLKSAVECLSATLACFQNPYLYCRGLAITHTPPPCHSTWAKQSLPAEDPTRKSSRVEIRRGFLPSQLSSSSSFLSRKHNESHTEQDRRPIAWQIPEHVG